MDRIYEAAFNNVVVTGPQDLFELRASDNTTVHISFVRIIISVDNPEDELEPMLISLGWGTSPGAEGTTVVPSDLGASPFGGTVKTNNKVQSVERTKFYEEWVTYGQNFPLFQFSRGTIRIAPGELFIAGLQVNPNNKLVLSGTLNFREIGDG